MNYSRLGRTGISASVIGLGCGGHSRLGLTQGKTEDEAANLVRSALDMGINFIDTAEFYGTEAVVGKGIRGVPREQIYLSTKAIPNWQDRLCTAPEMRMRIDACLGRLGVDYVDVFHLHAVLLEEYAYCREELVPLLLDMKTEGKIRFLGITEQFLTDTNHQMLRAALKDTIWDVMMIGFSILNPSARNTVLPETIRQDVGTLCMFAVRRALSRPAALVELMEGLESAGLIGAFDRTSPLGFLEEPGVAESLQDAAYRYCRWEPGMNVVLSGTGDLNHLRANSESLNRGPLPPATVGRLSAMFEKVDSVSGD